MFPPDIVLASGRLARRPRAVAAANIGAGLTFVAAGISILALAAVAGALFVPIAQP